MPFWEAAKGFDLWPGTAWCIHVQKVFFFEGDQISKWQKHKPASVNEANIMKSTKGFVAGKKKKKLTGPQASRDEVTQNVLVQMKTPQT